MKSLFSLALIFTCLTTYSQKEGNTKIIATVGDTIGLYEKIRLSLVKANFVVRDDRNPDTLTTYPRDTKPLGYVTLRVAINGNAVTFWGYTAGRYANYMGYTTAPREFKRILYYNNDRGKAWKIMRQQALKLSDTFSYE